MRLEEELKVIKFRSPFHRAGVNVIFTGAWMVDRMNLLLKPYGISEQQFNVLRILLRQKGKAANLCTIQEGMIHRMSNATRLVEKLRKKGLVNREICERNRRKVDITITRKGLKLLDEIDPMVSKFGSQTFKKLTKNEAQLLGELLDKMRI